MKQNVCKRLLALITFTLVAVTLQAQGFWKVESTTDDYTMEKSYVVSHYYGDAIDAVYFVNDSTLKIIKNYDGRAYFDACWKASVENDGKIDDYVGTVYCRIIRTSSDYDEYTLDDTVISYTGFGDDGKIDANGFFSYFYLQVNPEDLKKSSYITFRYYDKISDQIISKKVSLAGFTKAYNVTQ